jgi:hypothetical protein
MTRPKAVVVGIVADERHNGVTAASKEKFFVPHSQWHVVTNGSLVRNAFIVVRTSGDPLATAAPVRDAAPPGRLPAGGRRAHDGRRGGDGVGDAAPHRLPLGTFAAIALALAIVGSTACCRTWWRAARTKSASVSPWERRAATC